MLEGPGEDGQETAVLGVVVGLDAQEVAEAGHDAAVGVFNDGAEAGGAGVAAGAAVTVGGEPLAGGGGVGVVKEIPGHRIPV